MNAKVIIPDNITSVQELRIKNNTLEPFSDMLVNFVDDVSKSILKNNSLKEYPELISLAFWMRKSHIKKLQNYFLEQKKNKVLIGRGVVFHMAPSNVDTIFVYSWFISLLVGNSNILRISNKKNLQTDTLLKIISDVINLQRYAELKARVAIIRYGHDDIVTRELSLMADVRVIWGGDATIQHIRKIPIKSTATELTFADKFSFALINSNQLLEEKKLDSLIEKFYNDSFWFGQMACSSIRLIVWIGRKEDNNQAKNIFWERLDQYVSNKVPEAIVSADIVNKVVAECSMAIESEVSIIKTANPYINRVVIDDLAEIKEELHCGTGLFYETESINIDTIVNKMTRKHQTVSYYGFTAEQFKTVLNKCMPKGIDRIVPIGKSLEFSNVWDGFDLFNSFCREIEVWE